jgi:molecular chaperone DnaK
MARLGGYSMGSTLPGLASRREDVSDPKVRSIEDRVSSDRLPTPAGIDLCTTKSVIVGLRGDGPEAVRGSHGAPVSRPSSPSHRVVRCWWELRRNVRPCRTQGRTYWSFKHLLGRIKDQIVVDDRRYSPEDLAVFVLKQLKADGERHFDDIVSEAVMTVPASYDHSQVEATRRAAVRAGFEVLRIIREPTAAAVAYGAGQGTPCTDRAGIRPRRWHV